MSFVQEWSDKVGDILGKGYVCRYYAPARRYWVNPQNTPSFPGIYIVLNSIGGAEYIGQSQNLLRRLEYHHVPKPFGVIIITHPGFTHVTERTNAEKKLIETCANDANIQYNPQRRRHKVVTGKDVLGRETYTWRFTPPPPNPDAPTAQGYGATGDSGDKGDE